MTSTAITNRKTMPKAIVPGFWFNSIVAGQYGVNFNKAPTWWCFSLLTDLQRKICIVLSKFVKFSLGNTLQTNSFFLVSNSPQRRVWPLDSLSTPDTSSSSRQFSFPCLSHPTGVLGQNKRYGKEKRGKSNGHRRGGTRKQECRKTQTHCNNHWQGWIKKIHKHIWMKSRFDTEVDKVF